MAIVINNQRHIGNDVVIFMSPYEPSAFPAPYANNALAFDLVNHVTPSQLLWNYKFLCKRLEMQVNFTMHDLKGIGSIDKAERINYIDGSINIDTMTPIAPIGEGNPRADNKTFLQLVLERGPGVTPDPSQITGEYKGRYAWFTQGGFKITGIEKYLLFNQIWFIKQIRLRHSESPPIISMTCHYGGYTMLSNAPPMS